MTETLVFGYLGLALFAFEDDFDIGFIILGTVSKFKILYCGFL
jgi:hypothetical protein